MASHNRRSATLYVSAACKNKAVLDGMLGQATEPDYSGISSFNSATRGH